MDQTLITVLRYSITYYQKDLFICAQYANKHKATALHKAYWLPCCLCIISSGLIPHCNMSLSGMGSTGFPDFETGATGAKLISLTSVSATSSLSPTCFPN